MKRKIFILLFTIIISLLFTSCKKKDEHVSIIYNANNGFDVASEDILTSDFSSYELKILEKEGFIFLGWYSDENCENEVTKLDEDLIIDGKINLYASWIEVNNKDEFSYFTQITDTGYLKYNYNDEEYNYKYDFSLTYNTLDLTKIDKFLLYSNLYLKGDIDYDFDLYIYDGKIYLRGPVKLFVNLPIFKDTLISTLSGYVKISLDLNRLNQAIYNNYHVNILAIIQTIYSYAKDIDDYDKLVEYEETIKTQALSDENCAENCEDDIDLFFEIINSFFSFIEYNKEENGFNLSLSSEQFSSLITKTLKLYRLIFPYLYQVSNYFSTLMAKDKYNETIIDDFIIPNNLPYFYKSNREIIYYDTEYSDLGEILDNLFIPTYNDSYVFIVNDGYKPFNYLDYEEIDNIRYYFSKDGYSALSQNGDMISVSDYLSNILNLTPLELINGDKYYSYNGFFYDNDFNIIDGKTYNSLYINDYLNDDYINEISNNIQLEKFNVSYNNEEEVNLNIDLKLNYLIYEFTVEFNNDFNIKYIEDYVSSFNIKNPFDLTSIIIKYITDNNQS